MDASRREKEIQQRLDNPLGSDYGLNEALDEIQFLLAENTALRARAEQIEQAANIVAAVFSEKWYTFNALSDAIDKLRIALTIDEGTHAFLDCTAPKGVI